MLMVLAGCGDDKGKPDRSRSYHVPAVPTVLVGSEYSQSLTFGPYAFAIDPIHTSPQPTVAAPHRQSAASAKTPRRAPAAAREPAREPAREAIARAPAPAPRLTGVSLLQPEAEGTPVLPGGVLPLAVTVSADGDGEHEFQESFQLPPGWISLFEPAAFTIEGGGRRQRILVVVVPAGAPAGAYSVTYRVRLVGRPDLEDEITLPATVGACPVLEAVAGEHQGIVVAGDPFIATVHLINKGNITICVETTASSSEQFRVWPPVTTSTLEPGGGEELTFRVDTPGDLTRSVVHRLLLASRLTGVPTAGQDVVTCLQTGVLPRAGVEPDPWVRMPARLTLATMSEEGRRAWQGSLEGAGAIDEAGRHRLDFMLRSNDTRQQSMFGRQDEYRASYASDFMRLAVGDHYFNLSRLSSNYYYGRGASLSLRAGPDTDLGAHYARNRWLTSERQWSAYVRRRLSPWATAKMNVLYRDPSRLAGTNDRMISLETDLDDLRGEKLHLETAHGSRSIPGASDGNALRLLFSSDRDGRYLSFERIAAGRDYPGEFQNHEQTSGRLILRHGRFLETYAAVQQYESPSFGVSRSGSRQGGLNWSAGSGASRLFLEARRSYIDFTGGRSALGHDETSYRVGYERNHPRARLNISLETGDQTYEAAAESDRILRLSSFAHVPLGRNSALYLQGQLSGRDDAGGGLLGGGSYLSGSLNWCQPAGSRLSIRASADNLNSRVRAQSTQVDAACAWALARDLSLDLRLRHLRGSDDRTRNAILLSVTRGIGVSVGRRTSVGAVRGVMFDAEDVRRRGVPGVVVRLNSMMAITDSDGAFSFPAVEPGRLLLTVDRGTLGLDMTTRTPLPLMIEVKGGETERLEIGVSRASRVEGRVSLYISAPAVAVATDAMPGNTLFVEGSDRRSVADRPAGDRRYIQGSGLANIMVEISNGVTVRRKFTGEGGEFDFPELTPGAWTLKVSTGNLPPHHELEARVVEIDVAAGETVEIPLRVLPVLRGIEIIDSGELDLVTLD